MITCDRGNLRKRYLEQGSDSHEGYRYRYDQSYDEDEDTSDDDGDVVSPTNSCCRSVFPDD